MRMKWDDAHNRDGSHALFVPDVAKGADGYYEKGVYKMFFTYFGEGRLDFRALYIA